MNSWESKVLIAGWDYLWYNKSITKQQRVSALKEKICCTCKFSKSVSLFSKKKSTKDGYKQYCKQCANEKSRLYREKNKEKINQRNSEWYYKTKSERVARTQKELDKGYRVCTECGKQKDVRDFYERGNGGFYGECKNCHNQKVKIYTSKNRDVVLARKRKYYIRTREHHIRYFKKYSIENSQRNVERARRWAKSNPEKVKEIGVRAFHNRRAKMAKVENDFTRKDWNECKNFFRLESGLIDCAYCNKNMKNATLEHFIPIHKSGNHTADNILPICQSCNSKKSASDFHEWYPLMDFYSKDNVDRIEKYFDSLKNYDNHEPSASETM